MTIARASYRCDERNAMVAWQPVAGAVGYWVAVESFDENGVSALSSVVPIR